MFKTPLNTTRMIGTENTWRLNEALAWEDNVNKIKVPAGFVYDGASVFRLGWWFLQPMGSLADRAVCLHDWCYGTEAFSRKDCDKLFYNAMLDDKTPKWKAWPVYQMVRMWGWTVWRKHTKESVKKLRTLAYQELSFS